MPDPTYRRGERSPSGARIALTLLGVMAAVLLGILGISKLAGALAGGAKPDPAPQTASVVATPVIAAETTPPAPAVTPKKVAVVPKPKPATKLAPTPVAPAKSTGYVVVIDPGHQGIADSSSEPIGPGSSVTKPAVASGASRGGVPESLLNLQISLRLRQVLEARGVKVIMVRTSENVDIANSARAKIANDAHANLFIRLHCDDVSDSSTHGLLMLVPGANQWTGPIAGPSARAGRDIQNATLATTGANDRGITPRTDMAGFNWSKVPAVIVEMGLMSNPAELSNLRDPAYQLKLATGIANGTMAYLQGR